MSAKKLLHSGSHKANGQALNGLSNPATLEEALDDGLRQRDVLAELIGPLSELVSSLNQLQEGQLTQLTGLFTKLVSTAGIIPASDFNRSTRAMCEFLDSYM